MPDELRIVWLLAQQGGFALAAWGIVRRLLPGRRPSEDLLHAFLLYVAIEVATGTALGFVGGLLPLPTTIAAIALGGVGARLVATAAPRQRLEIEPLSHTARAALCLAAAALTVSVVRYWRLPPLLTDALSYHLAFPARWLQEGSLVRTPAQYNAGIHAYFPANQEVLAAWWMLPLSSEVLARFIQVPFLCAGALAAYVFGTARGLSRDAGAALAAAYLLLPPFLNQTIGGPYNDVTVSCLLLIALCACDTTSRDRWRGAVLFGVALGLAVGTKYVAVPYALPLLVAFALARPGIVPGALAVALAGLAGGAWYVQNLATTGDPVYPGDLKVFGVTLAKGLYAADIYPRDLSLRGAVRFMTRPEVSFAISPSLLACLALAPLACLARRRDRVSTTLLPVLFFLAGHLLVPLQDPRYYFAFFAILVLSLGAASTLLPRRASLLPSIALSAAGLRAWWTPAMGSPWVPLLVAGALFVAWMLVPRVRLDGLRAPASALGVLVALAGAWPFAAESYHSLAYAPPEASIYPLSYGSEGSGWAWVAEATREAPATIACAGTGGRVFPLFGEGLRNRVLYVPVRSGPERLVHEYGVHYDRPTPLIPFEQAEEVLRREPDPLAWRERLERRGVRFLFVTGTERNGAPLLERTWADADPSRFQVVFQDGDTAVYRVLR